MGDDKSQPAFPESLGAGEPLPAPRTFRGRPTLPGGIVPPIAAPGLAPIVPTISPPGGLAPIVPTITPPGGLAPITPTMPVLERALLPMKGPLPPPRPPPSRPSAASFAPSPPPGMPSPPPSYEELERIDDDGTPVPITLPSASLDPAAQMALASEGPPVAVRSTVPVGDDPATAAGLVPTPLPSHVLDPAHPTEPFDPLGLFAVPAPGADPAPRGAFDVNGPTAGPDARDPFDVHGPGGAFDGLDPEPSSIPPASSGRRQIAIAPDLPQIPKPVSLKPMQHAPGIVSTQAIPLTVPLRRTRRSPLLVAIVFALVGGAVALVVLLATKPRTSAEAAGAGPSDPLTSATTSPTVAASSTATREPASAAGTGAAASTATATAAAAPSAATSSPSGTSSAAAASSSADAAGARPSAAPASTLQKPRPKSDRIED